MRKRSVQSSPRIAVVGNSAERGNLQSRKETELAANAFGLQLQYLAVKNYPKDIETAFRGARKSRAEAVVLASVVFLSDRQQLAEPSMSENSSQPRRDIAGQIWGHPQFMNGQNVRFVKYLDVSFSSPRLHQSLRRFDRSRNGLRVQGTKVQSSGPPWTLTGNPNTLNCERQSALASTNVLISSTARLVLPVKRSISVARRSWAGAHRSLAAR